MKSADEVIKEIDEIIDAADVEEEEAEAAAAEAAAAAEGTTPGGPTGSYLPNMMPLMSSRRVSILTCIIINCFIQFKLIEFSIHFRF